ncbi:Hypothetical protein R9X50_00349200 [Acrodontium crateriforme]|uniref:Uncharacterized protein n=1 Tax=Acrodontium crateriforme TaxID=150365 RepID=A0AAQ3M953_9PEZI|nr:Hypothetical protein R9X50_00349200 [Acrodontium crateriforme]
MYSSIILALATVATDLLLQAGHSSKMGHFRPAVERQLASYAKVLRLEWVSLMQDHNGSGTCNDNGHVQNPCPSSEIHQMIQDGVAGTSRGDGLKQTIQEAKNHPTTGAQNFYAAARIYNSGSATYSNLDDGRGSTPCYASDVANRLIGWTLATGNCTA